ncbi:AAA family ATPase [Methanolobus sp. ZRKC5]|uniref:AAA family ATPase n=1 Tax=unclassified Methanolobus TaxID=2629569 RepID=UPI00313B1E73
MKNESFRLIKLEIENHQFLNKISIDFIEDKKYSNHLNNPFTTLIIGSNGTGKSQILRIIIDIFKELESHKYPDKELRTRRIPKYNYELKYQINDNVYVVASRGKANKKCLKNYEVIKIDNLELPNRLLASSFMVNDKHLYSNNDFYKYLGIRSVENAAFTKGFAKNVANEILEATDRSTFICNLKKTLEFLGYDHFLKITYKLRIPKRLREEASIENLHSYLETKSNSQAPLSTIYKSLTNEEIQNIIRLLNNRANDKFIEYNILSENGFNKNHQKEHELLQVLQKLRLVSSPVIEVKKGQTFGLTDASSGESHFIFSMFRIIANIKDNSLVLIDEPEISLHPNWQMKYIYALNNIFSNYSSCHFILATHSHFMISDLEKDSSSIITLRFESDKGIQAITHKENTYGWTAEDILYNVFKVPTIRNYYLANEVGEILSAISQKNRDIDEIEKRVRKLKEINTNLKEIDPMKRIIDKIIGKFD